MTLPASNPSNSKSLAAKIADELRPRQLLPSLTAGLTIGVIVIIIEISLASLIFAGPLADYVSTGILLVLLSAVIVGTVVALFSSLPGIIAAPQEAPAVILALVATSIANTMPPGSTPEATFLTVVAVIAITSVLTGLLYLLLGHFQWGEFIRFLPYPVIGGFLAGTGWLLVVGAIAVMTGISPSVSTLSALLQPEMLLRWLPALIFAILLLAALNRYDQYWIMPAMLLGAVVLFYGVAWLTNASVATLSAQGWLLDPPQEELAQSFAFSDLAQVNWRVIIGQGWNIAAILVISVVALLLNASSIELSVGEDVDLNRELQVAGIGNVLTGFLGGLLGFQALSLSALSYKVGRGNRLAGLIAAALCGLVLFWGMALLSFLPKLLLGSMLMLLGLSFLMEWVYKAWFKFPRTDYLIIIAILFVIATVGFLQGVMLGIALALILFVVNYSRVNVIKHALTGETYQSRVIRGRTQRQLLADKGNEIQILQLQGFIFFGTANNLLNQVRQRLEAADLPPLRYAILDFRQVTGVDSTAALSFAKMQQLAEARQVALVFTTPIIEDPLPGQDDSVANLCAELEDSEKAEPERLVRIFPDLDHGMEWCEDQILLNAGIDPLEGHESLRVQLRSLLPDDTTLDRIVSYFERLEVDAGYCLMKQGDPPDDLYFIEAGQVTAQLQFPDRPPLRLETVRGGAVVGEIGFYLNQPRSAAVFTDEPSTLYRLSAQALQRMEQNDLEAAAAFHQAVIRLVSERLTRSLNTVNARLG